MALLFGDNLTEDGQPKGNVGLNHSRVRTTTFNYVGTPTDSDQLIFGFIKSTDRIKDIRVSVVDGSATAGAMNVGLWTATLANNSVSIAVDDADLFASAFSINADVAYPGTSVFEESGTLTIASRGKPAWDLLAANSEDPGVTYAIVGEISTTADAAVILLVEIEYAAGD